MWRLTLVFCWLAFYSAFAESDKESSIKAIVHKALKATARQCMQRTNASEQDLESLRKEPPFPEKSACILTCLMEKINHHVASSCQLGNEIVSCIYKHAPELHFKS